MEQTINIEQLVDFNICYKWPHIFIKGDKVTEEQAMDIIIKTNYFRSGNIPNELKELLPETNILEGFKVEGFENSTLTPNEYDCGISYFWCDFDGTIQNSHIDMNIGVKPNAYEIYKLLSHLAKEFPYLNMIVQIGTDENDNYNLDGKLDIDKVKIIISYHINKGYVNINIAENQKVILSKSDIKSRNRVNYTQKYLIKLVKEHNNKK